MRGLRQPHTAYEVYRSKHQHGILWEGGSTPTGTHFNHRVNGGEVVEDTQGHTHTTPKRVPSFDEDVKTRFFCRACRQRCWG